MAAMASRPDVPAPSRSAMKAADDWARRGSNLAGRGQLGTIVRWLSGVQDSFPPTYPEHPRLVIFASASLAATGTFDEGRAAEPALTGVAVASRAGVPFRAVDPGHPPSDKPPGTLSDEGQETGDQAWRVALTAQAFSAAQSTGSDIADQETDTGTDLILLAWSGTAATRSSLALSATLLGADPVDLTGTDSHDDDQAWIQLHTQIRDSLWRSRSVPRRAEDLAMALADEELVSMASFLARCSQRRTPVLLDGPVAVSAALLAERLAPGARRWWQCAHVSGNPGASKALDELQMSAWLDLETTLQDGTAAVAALGLLGAAVAAATSPDRFRGTS